MGDPRITGAAKTSIQEIQRRLEGYEVLHAFVLDLALWDGTTDSWYQLFSQYREGAKNVINRVTPL